MPTAITGATMPSMSDGMRSPAIARAFRAGWRRTSGRLLEAWRGLLEDGIEESSMATVLIEKDVLVPMRDGVRLAADVYRPADTHGEDAGLPVLLMRTPYHKGGAGGLDVLRIVEAGYAVVVQDCRGRFASEGEFDPMVQERADGADTVAWIAGQAWSNGKIGTVGG